MTSKNSCCEDMQKGVPLSEFPVNEISAADQPENTAPYDEGKLISGAEEFFKNHPFIRDMK